MTAHDPRKPRWHAALYAFMLGSFLAGLLVNVVVVAFWRPALALCVPLYAMPAAFGAAFAGGLLREEMKVRGFVKRHPNMPVTMSLDVGSRYATVTTMGGGMVSLEIPDDVVDAGPEAITAYVLDELDPPSA